MNIRHLEIFLSVCEHMSISKAAESLYLSQPAVSIAIKELEEYYNTRLFDRISRKIYLTSSGEKLLNYAHVILGQIEESVTSLRDDALTKSCHMGVNITIGETYLCELLDYLKTNYPDIKPHVTINNMKTIEHDLIQNKYDFVMSDSLPASSNLILEDLYKEEMVFVCAKDYINEDELDVSEMIHHTLLVREVGSGIRKCVDRFLENYSLVVDNVIESSSNRALIDLCKNGFGIGVMPYSLVKEELEKGDLKKVELKDVHLIREYYLVYYKNKYLSEYVKAYMEDIKSYFQHVYLIANKK